MPSVSASWEHHHPALQKAAATEQHDSALGGFVLDSVRCMWPLTGMQGLKLHRARLAGAGCMFYCVYIGHLLAYEIRYKVKPATSRSLFDF